MSDRPEVPGPEDPTPADVPRGEADVPSSHDVPASPDERTENE